METIKYHLWLNPNRSGMFFSKHVLIVEGPSEIALINKLRDDRKLNLPNGTYILDSFGKYNTHRFMNLLNHLNILHSVIYDDDDDNKDNEHKKLNQLIEESKGDCTVNINSIQETIEKMLGISEAKKSHRKPQHILFQYANNKINDSKLQEFCQIVESCFN